MCKCKAYYCFSESGRQDGKVEVTSAKLGEACLVLRRQHRSEIHLHTSGETTRREISPAVIDRYTAQWMAPSAIRYEAWSGTSSKLLRTSTSCRELQEAHIAAVITHCEH